MPSNAVYVSFRGSINLSGNYNKTVYWTIPVPVAKKDAETLKRLPPNSTTKQTLVKRVIKHAEANFDAAEMSVAPTLHPFRSIDDMRMGHAYAGRRCVYSEGSTAPGESPISVWL